MHCGGATSSPRQGPTPGGRCLGTRRGRAGQGRALAHPLTHPQRCAEAAAAAAAARRAAGWLLLLGGRSMAVKVTLPLRRWWQEEPGGSRAGPGAGRRREKAAAAAAAAGLPRGPGNGAAGVAMAGRPRGSGSAARAASARRSAPGCPGRRRRWWSFCGAGAPRRSQPARRWELSPARSPVPSRGSAGTAEPGPVGLTGTPDCRLWPARPLYLRSDSNPARRGINLLVFTGAFDQKSGSC